MKKIYKILIAAFIFRIALSFIIWHPDLNNHVDWGIRFWQYGPAKFYDPSSNVWSFTWPNQPPGAMIIFALIRKLYETIFSFFWFLNVKIAVFPSNIMLFFEKYLYQILLKLPSIISDLGIAYIIYKIFVDRKKEKLGILGAALFLFNPVIWYNSAIWGQTDALINYFVILAFYLLSKKKLLPACISFAVSLYIKISLAVFIPVFIVVAFGQKYKLKKILLSVLVPVILIGVLTLPFSRGEPFNWLIRLYQENILGQQMQVITANAFNIWAGLTGVHEQSHKLLLGPISYQVWGQIFFVVSILPAFYIVCKKRDLKTIFWSLALISFSSFMFLTNMHERYLYPLFPYLTALVVWNMDLLFSYIGVSFINLLNLYHLWWFPKIQLLLNLLSFNNRLIPRILGLANFVLFILIYLRALRLLRLRKI